ncbi:MAG: isocitrate/isopropylmalate dehydrogenase family protein [Candidatus Puniceispirillaceae bacterium]|jgi:3-isopropylmalate dehydrogenase
MVKKRQLLCLNGDGISEEIMAATLAVFDTVRPLLRRPVTIIEDQVGFAALAQSGTTITEAVIKAAASADGIILGPVSHNSYPPVADGGLNPSGVLRKTLSLYANIRPAFSFDGLPKPTKHKFDLVVMRENLEGFYADRNMADGPGEVMPVDGVALAFRRITREASYNIAKAGFELAMKRQKKTVTAIHKANVMRLSDGLFLDTVRDVAASYPDIAYDEMLVDAAAALLVRDPGRFDVLVTTNMFGDILSDLASELSGGLGLAGSLNAGHDHVMAQAQHGSAPDIAGQDKANPTSLILSLAMLLHHWGETDAADRINNAVATLLATADARTVDLGGMLTCSAFAALLCQHISGD